MHLELDQPLADGVSLFLLTPGHVTEVYVSWLNDTAVNQYLESRFGVHTIESTKSFVQAMLYSPDHLFLGIRSQISGGHVGNIKIGPINRHYGTAEIGILIGEQRAWGKGIATSAIRIVCEIARTRLALRKVTAGCYASNVGSQKAFEKAGFQVEGIRKQQVIRDGRPEDIVLLGKLLA